MHKDTTQQGSERQDFYRHGKKKKNNTEQTPPTFRLGLPYGNPVKTNRLRYDTNNLYTDVVLFFFSFFSKTWASARERKIKNDCRHLWEKKGFIKSLPHVNALSLSPSSTFTVPIKFDQGYWGCKLLV